ncbi:hypothetical protein FOPG_18928 [Fusarium oxysporum f. sp. conglutinans race 2 54008]|uniref:Chromo domain-containing protein n=2 Tax=Fusarium oxysporum f. sp. conglutinans TaxID=100902 RepID=A0A8H6LDQ5_FUSOX|nr:hypothetical protein FOPG_18928 [Fusarium oxysporum f. sp. conglutinans race 2 54008]KAF6515418.1 hypothetical protein HZS61_005324 [Fusarium oxysporum f. sp. conglutinans]KAG6980427.1 Chromo domain-containing protein 2 [Fusarium oxysporum f. sp. conglutinans]KAI8401770.1 hypothetical protein FOFC_18639 [Fusarium oxysporum]
MPPAPSDDKSLNQGKFTALTQGNRRSTSDSQLLVVNLDQVETPKGTPTGESDKEDGELEDGLFIVETIKNHATDKNGNLMFQVKWKGFESKKDLTWEPEDNLKVSGDEILNEYFNAIGGRDKIFEESNRAVRTKKRRRTTNGIFSTRPKRLQRNEAHVGNKTLLAVMKKWSPPSGSWEDEIEKIDACEEDENGKLIVYLIWKNGQKTNHGTQIIYEKCPQKMLQFYEEHVKITGEEKCHERRHEGLLGGVIP